MTNSINTKIITKLKAVPPQFTLSPVTRGNSQLSRIATGNEPSRSVRHFATTLFMCSVLVATSHTEKAITSIGI
jgi:hypothetical protein